MTRQATLLALLCALSMPAHAGEETDRLAARRDEIEAEQAKALERNAEPGADPWSVGDSTELFTRPSFREAIKLSPDLKEGQYTLSITPAEALPKGEYWWLRGFRISAGWKLDDTVLSGGLTWSASLRDARLLSNGEIQLIDKKAAEARQLCTDRPPAGLTMDERRTACQRRYNETVEKGVQRYWWPAFSFGASAAYDRANRQRSHVKANAAIEFQGESGISITGNADFIDEPVENMQDVYTARTGGGLALSYRPRRKLLKKLVLTAGAKYLYCLRECMDQKSPLDFGASIKFAIADNALVGLSMLWKDEDLRDPAVGLALSLSLDKLPWITE